MASGVRSFCKGSGDNQIPVERLLRLHRLQALCGRGMAVAEPLNGVAVGGVEVDALGHAVAPGMIDLQPQHLETIVELPQRLEVFNLQGHVVESQATGRHWQGVGRRSEQGKVMVDLAAGQEHRPLGRFPCHLKAQHLGVELKLIRQGLGHSAPYDQPAQSLPSPILLKQHPSVSAVLRPSRLDNP